MNDRDRNLDYTKQYSSTEEQQKVKKNVTKACFLREIGQYRNGVPTEFQWAAEDKLVEKDHEELKCELTAPRSTFLMVFSPDGKKVASTHGNHNVYVTDLTTGKNISTLVGHPRTPWSIAFHPSSNQILASGCLGGQVRVWDLHGGSEVWTADSQSVIASLAFHPVDRTLVIATYNELHFWDWSQPQPFAKCSTKSEREKVRYVAFDRLGTKLITGIANPVSSSSAAWERSVPVSLITRSTPTTPSVVTTASTTTTTATTASTNESDVSFSYCYRDLMNQYNQLVRRYFDLSRSRITPTTDRGTDPMDENDNNTTSTSSSATSTSTSTSTSPYSYQCNVPSISILHQAATFVNNSESGSLTTTTPTHLTTTTTTVSSFVPRRSERTRGSATEQRNTSTSTVTFSGNESISSSQETTSSSRGDRRFVLLRDLISELERNRPTEGAAHNDFSSLLSLANLATSERSHVPVTTDNTTVTTTASSGTSSSTDSSSRLQGSRNLGSLRRQLFFRPGGQYVLSRHSNSPFQPRSQQFDATQPSGEDRQDATLPESTRTTSTGADSESPSGLASSPRLNLTQPERAAYFRRRAEIRRSVYDHYRTLVGDRVRSTNDNTHINDTTIDFSSNDGEDPPPTTSTARPAAVDPLDTNRLTSLLYDDEDDDDDDDDNDDDSSPGAARSSARYSVSHRHNANIRRGIQLLSDHIQNMQRLCRARIEMLQLQQIRRMWEELTTQVKTLHSLIRNSRGLPGTSSQSSNNRVSDHVSNMMRLARISDPVPSGETTTTATESPLATESQTTTTAPAAAAASAPMSDDDSDMSSSEGDDRSKRKRSKSFETFVGASQTSRTTPQNDSSCSSDEGGEFQPSTTAATTTTTSTSTATPSTTSSSQVEDNQQPSTSTGSRGGSDPYDTLFEMYSKRIYKSLRDIIRKTRSRRDVAGSGRSSLNRTMSGSSGRRFWRHSEPPGRRFRIVSTDRSGTTVSSRTMSPSQLFRELESMFQVWKKDKKKSISDKSTEASTSTSTTSESQPSTSSGRNSGSDSCVSCGKSMSSSTQPSTSKCTLKNRRKSSEPTRNNGGDKLKRMNNSTAVPVGSGAGGSESTSAPGPSTSTSSTASSLTDPQPNSTTELLRKMLETMIHYQREAFRRAEELRGERPIEPPEEDTVNRTSQGGAGGATAGRFRNTNTDGDVLVYRRNLVQLRARHLLELMMECLTIFFEDTSHVLDEQIFYLCSLLHLALELTDLLLEELNLTSRDLEQNWAMSNFELVTSTGRDVPRSSYSRYRQRTLGRSSTLRSSTSGAPSSSSGQSRDRGCCSTSSSCCTSNSSSNKRRTRSALLFSRRTRLPSTRSSSSGQDSTHTYCPDRSYINRMRRIPCTSRAGIAVYLANRRRYPSMVDPPFGDRAEERLIDREIEPPVPPSPPPTPTSTPTPTIGVPTIYTGLTPDTNNMYRLLPFPEPTTSDGNNVDPAPPGRSVRTYRVVQFNPDVQVIPEEQQRQGSASGTGGSASTHRPPMYYFRFREPANSSRTSEASNDGHTIWIRYRSAPTSTTTATSQPASESTSRDANFNVPIVQVNDVPVSDASSLNQPRTRPQSPDTDGSWRWRTWRPRFLHPRYLGPNPFDEPPEPSGENVESVYYRVLNSGGQLHTFNYEPVVLSETPLSPHHRIQAWDFSKLNIPDITPRDKNVVVPECKIHNDASVDVSNDGHLLVTLLSSGRFINTTMLGVYSLDWNSLGQLLYKTSFEQSAVSVSLSPTSRYLLVGLASRALVLRSGDRTNMAQIFRLDGAKPNPPGKTWHSGRGRLVHIRDLEQVRDTNFMSLNCIRWAPGPGQGIVYGTNTGVLKVLR